MGVEGRVAVVTGGAQGIGKAVAGRFLRDGMSVAILDADREAGEETEREYRELGEVLFIHADVADERMVAHAMATVVERFGALRVLVNNAGIFIGKPVQELALEEWNRVLSVNLTGVFLCAREAAPYLRKEGGVVLNVASTRAFMSEADTESYSASKGGVFALSHALAMSLGPAVRVNCISPGWIDVSEWKKSGNRAGARLTEADHAQHPAGRVGIPEDVASLAAFLVSDESSFITGANFFVDGGMTRKMIYV